MCVCVYVYMCMNMHVCVCACACIVRACVCMCLYLCFVCLHVCTWGGGGITCLCVGWGCLFKCVCLFEVVYVPVYVLCLSLCEYVYLIFGIMREEFGYLG